MPPVCSALAELSGMLDEVPVAALVGDAELLIPLDEEPVDALAALEGLGLAEAPEDVGELDEGAVGRKLSFLAPKPTFEAKRPATETGSVLYLPVITRLPLPLSDAVTCALPATFVLMAPIRSLTASVPVDAYVVALVPSLTVIVPFGGIPRVSSGVFNVSGTVPVPVAGTGLDEFERPAELEELELEDEGGDADAVGLLLEDDRSSLCMAAVSWVLTRVNAVWLAMLARPFAWLIIAEPIAEISASLCASA